MNLRQLIAADLSRYSATFRQRGEGGERLRIVLESLFFKAGFQAVFLFRLAHWLHGHGLTYLAWAVCRLNQFLTACEMEYNATIGPGLMIPHPMGLMVGRGCRLGKNVTLYQNVTLGVSDWRKEKITRFPRIGDNVFIFAGAVVVGDIQVGDNAVIGANAVVIEDVPAGALAVGNPARILPGRGAELVAASGLPALDQEE
ncbi:MAG: serine acetyltransferase [Magnetococcales bacterium]|nr:serine acetyltransferase [Magnetococcales bacterium]NGZ28676.1 serine acetyltransferase [Magnetococcales bacterium]